MKADESVTGPALNLLEVEGVQEQSGNVITQILLNDNNWYQVEEGSFHIFRSTNNDKAMPYVQFDTPTVDGIEGIRIQVFPATVAGWAFPVPKTNE